MNWKKLTFECSTDVLSHVVASFWSWRILVSSCSCSKYRLTKARRIFIPCCYTDCLHVSGLLSRTPRTTNGVTPKHSLSVRKAAECCRSVTTDSLASIKTCWMLSSSSELKPEGMKKRKYVQKMLEAFFNPHSFKHQTTNFLCCQNSVSLFPHHWSKYLVCVCVFGNVTDKQQQRDGGISSRLLTINWSAHFNAQLSSCLVALWLMQAGTEAMAFTSQLSAFVIIPSAKFPCVCNDRDPVSGKSSVMAQTQVVCIHWHQK